MKTIGDLTGTVSEEEWDEPRGSVATAHYEVAPGCFIHVALQSAGILIFHGKTKIGIPMASLGKLVQAHEESFRPSQVAAANAQASAAAEDRLKHELMTRKLAARERAAAVPAAPAAPAEN